MCCADLLPCSLWDSRVCAGKWEGNKIQTGIPLHSVWASKTALTYCSAVHSSEGRNVNFPTGQCEDTRILLWKSCKVSPVASKVRLLILPARIPQELAQLPSLSGPLSFNSTLVLSVIHSWFGMRRQSLHLPFRALHLFSGTFHAPCLPGSSPAILHGLARCLGRHPWSPKVVLRTLPISFPSSR